jgi:hypothetical protein
MEERIYETISPFANHWVTLSNHWATSSNHWVTLTSCFYNIILLWILKPRLVMKHALKYYESIDLFQDIKILVNKPDEESS